MVDEDFKKFEKYVFASSNGTTCVPTTVDKSVPVEEGTSSSPTMAKPATADNTARYKYKNLAFVLGLTTITFLVSTIVLVTKQSNDSPSNALSAMLIPELTSLRARHRRPSLILKKTMYVLVPS